MAGHKGIFDISLSFLLEDSANAK
ncbi:uncharacterized protein G2W53_023765 [Senna tora]|uniref:Uncharacterized protein n=1 Tax=Senna tora TaxID=362788 RepID=A0A834TAN4_9FABA|nr:uncharacterized protein G2W53_023765 [Senna tora]